MFKDDCNLVEDAIIMPPNYTCIIPTQLTEGLSRQNGDSSSVATALTDQMTTTMLQTSVMTQVLDSESPPSMMAIHWQANAMPLLGDISQC
eukprot:3659863-Ditylum_brightwellii.AAC.1